MSNEKGNNLDRSYIVFIIYDWVISAYIDGTLIFSRWHKKCMKQQMIILLMFAGIALTVYKKYWLIGILMMLSGMYLFAKRNQN